LSSASLRLGVGACLLAFSGASNAQFGASLGVESDARFRGISLSGGRPDLRLSLSYDHASGVYAGDVGAVNPRVTAANALFPARRDGDRRHVPSIMMRAC